jgi:hypothetical protein
MGSNDTNAVAAKKVNKADGKALFGDAVHWEFESDLAVQIKYYGESLDAIFLSIQFNGAAIKDLPGFKNYNYNSPWNIQVGIYDGKGNDIDFSKPGLSSSQQIMRHKRFGEVPSFRFRKDRYNSEYNTILELDQ